MIRRFLPISGTLFLCLSLCSGQSRIGEWRHYTSTISPQAIAFHDSLVYMATGGGVLIYDPQIETFSTLSIAEGLVYTDLNCLAFHDNLLWLGGAPPRGIIQIVDLTTSNVDIVDLGLEEILHLQVGADRGFATFKEGQDVGILELRWDGSRFGYADIYRNFPVPVTDILDLDMWGDSLFVTTNSGVLGNDVAQANLKDPLTWIAMTPSRADLFQYHVDSTGHYFLVPSELHRRTMIGWELFRTVSGTTYKQLKKRSNGEFVLSFSSYLQFLTPAGARISSSRARERVLAYTDGETADRGYAIIRNQGLASYQHTTRSWTYIQPNTMAGQAYAAILKLSTGELVAAGLMGITKYNGHSWYNLLPGYYLTGGPDDERIHGNWLVTQSPFFLADTIFFRGKQSWNLLERLDGSIFVGFKGNPTAGAGILQLDFADIEGYQSYDTTDGMLDGLSSDGYITIRHMALDRFGNAWIANPFAQLRENAIAIYTSANEWFHFSVPDSRSALSLTPTEITFDHEDRVWIGNVVDEHFGTSGGISILDYGVTLQDKTDDEWTRLSARLEPDHSNTVWSLIFDNNNILWILSPEGVMGYQVRSDLSLSPFTQFGPFLRDVRFGEGSKIRVDAQNNKWITSPQNGLWVLLDNTTFWPSVDGINTGNSALLSDEILDIYLDDEEGMAYLATSKGISVLKIPFKRMLDDYQEMVIFPSPYRIPSEKKLIIDGLRQGSSVKIFTATGRLVRELTVQGGGIQGYQAAWDGKNADGVWVGSAVYVIVGYLESGRSGVGKVAVIRR